MRNGYQTFAGVDVVQKERLEDRRLVRSDQGRTEGQMAGIRRDDGCDNSRQFGINKENLE